MSNQEHVEIIGKALRLQQDMEQKESFFRAIQSEKFKSEPNEPQKGEYPEIEPTVKWDWKKGILGAIACWVIGGMLGIALEDINGTGWALGLIVPFAGIIWIIVYTVLTSKKKKANIEKIRQSIEYKQKCADVDRRYELALETYKNETLPTYQNEKAEWEAEYDGRLKEAKTQYDQAVKVLEDFYRTTKIVPKQYQTIPALTFIHDMMATSDYGVKEAIDYYERDEARKREEEAMRQREESNAIEAAKVEALEEQNAIAEQARKDRWKQEAIRALQHHNTNKSLRK